ncbi:MAG: recombination mediator RecR [Spirochaetia bacterium]
MNTLDGLIRSLSRLPGIGPKSAARLAYYLLQSDQRFNHTLGEQIRTVQEKIKKCKSCGNYTEAAICEICSNPNRDKRELCIVETPQDLQTIESTREYRGLYHVLHGHISPLDGIRPEDLNFNLLQQKIKENQVTEVIIATNPTVEGDATALYIVDMLKADDKLRISRLASGVAVGGDLEYTDRLTLARSLKGRIPFHS